MPTDGETPTMELELLTEDEIDALANGDGLDLVIEGLDMKLDAIFVAQTKLRRRRKAKPEEHVFVNARLKELDLEARPIMDRIDALESTRAGFSAPTADQVKEIRLAVLDLSRFNARATAASEIFETSIKIAEMVVGNNALATA